MNNNSNEGRILGIDFGHRRLGVAVSDPLRISAQALPTIKVRHIEQVISELKTIILEKKVSEIVIGMPLRLKGGKGTTALQVDQFIELLKTEFNIPVHPWDERLTSVAAERTMKDLGKSPSRNKAKVDQISAQIILQSFLNYLEIKSRS